MQTSGLYFVPGSETETSIYPKRCPATEVKILASQHRSPIVRRLRTRQTARADISVLTAERIWWPANGTQSFPQIPPMSRPCNLLSQGHNIYSYSEVNIAGLEAKYHFTQSPHSTTRRGKILLMQHTKNKTTHLYSFHAQNSIFNPLSQFYGSYGTKQPNSGHQFVTLQGVSDRSWWNGPARSSDMNKPV